MKNYTSFPAMGILLILFSFQSLLGNAEKRPDLNTLSASASCQIDPGMITATVTDASCPGSNDGSIMIEVNGPGTFNMCISQGCEMDDTTPNILKTQTAIYFNLAPGNYLVTVTDADGCIWYECFEVGEPEQIGYILDYEPIYCFGHSTEISVAGTGGTPPYILVDQNGSELAWFYNDVVIIGVTAGTHIWYLHDSNDCTKAQIEFTLNEPEPIITSMLSIEHGLCFGHESGSVQFSVTGGAPPYVFNMGDYQDGILTVENLHAGNHNLTVSDSKNCGPGEITFEIEEPEEINITIVQISPSTSGGTNGQIKLQINGGLAPFYISLNEGCEPVEEPEEYIYCEGEDIITFNGLEPGWKKINVTDQNSCVISYCVDIGIQQPDSDQMKKPGTSTDTLPDLKKAIKVFPNPFREHTHIELVLPEESYVILEIFNITGLRVASLFSGYISAFEKQQFTLLAESLPNGIYLCKLTIENKVITKRIILTR